MQRFRHMSINRKLTGIILLACTCALMLAGVSLIGAEWTMSRRAMAEDMTMLADLLGRYSTAPLSFHREEDVEEVEKNLGIVQADPSILAVGVYDKDHRIFGKYINPGSSAKCPVQLPPDGYRFMDSHLELSYPVLQGQKRIGTIYLLVDLTKIYGRLKLHAGIVGVVLLVTAATVLALSSRLRRPIAEPILALAGVARRVAEQKDYSVRAARQSGDEVGILTDAFNQMLSEIETGQRSLQQANQALLEQTGQLSNSINVLASSSGQILATSMELTSGATQTATAIRETTTTLDLVRETVLATSQSAKSVAQEAQAVVQISLGGKKSVQDTIQGMENVRRQVDSIAESMVRLSEQTQAIGHIIATVDDLAAQSNLLAVNASIEAARAGDHGKGFMVVAQEVRNLAEQSRQATNQVRGILNDVQKAVSAAVMATEQGTKAVEAGVQQSSRSGETIQTLANSVAEGAQAAMRIANSSQQQLTGTDQVATAMTEIEHTSAQNAASARQLEAAAQNLKALGEQLKKYLEKCAK